MSLRSINPESLLEKHINSSPLRGLGFSSLRSLYPVILTGKA
jgi:hypothetical protein